MLSTPATVFYRRVVGLVTAAILAVLLWRIVAPFLAPLAWAVFLAFLLQPLQGRLVRRFRGRESLAAALLTLLTLLLFVGPLGVLGAMFAAQAGELALQVQRLAVELEVRSFNDLLQQPWLQGWVGWAEEHLAVSATQLQAWAVAGAQRVLAPLAAMGGAFFLETVGTVASFLFMLILLFFLVRDATAIAAGLRRLVPMDAAHKEHLFARLSAVTRAVVFGTLVTAMVQGLLVGMAFAVAGLPSPVVFGVLAAVLSVVPFGGTALVWGPAVIALAVQGDYLAAALLFAFGAGVVGTVDNLLKPMLISGKGEVPTLAVFIGVLGGLAAFGLVGMFLGPVVIALALELLSFLGEGVPPEG
jgi:predicted PurR-regulated permease PerM